MGQVVNPELIEALEMVSAGIDALSDAGLSATDSREASSMFERIEGLVRRLTAAQVDLLADADARSLHSQDLALSAKVFMRHHAKLSAAEATARNNLMRALRDLPAIAEAYRQGLIAEANARRVASTWSNERVRNQLIADEHKVMRKAAIMNHPHFCRHMAGWERLADEDGAERDDQTTHDKRKASIIQNFDKGFSIEGSCGQLQGAMITEIWKQFTDAEFKLDWAKAVEKFGEGNVTKDMLERTDAQRRMDALATIFDQAASTEPGGTGPGFVLNIVMDWHTYQRELARLAGHPVAPQDPNRADYRCETLDGAPLSPTEVASHSLLAHVRRVVIGADNVTINMGRNNRLFTGPAAIAAKIGSNDCYWPSCWARATDCQIDHLEPYNGTRNGRTDQDNSGPLCAKHNRLKQTHSFTTWRDNTGQWHVRRPDGTELDP
ncbi:MAG: HNH endonuclease [Actinomycetia bacterium]|nr:HNH endonuclease [Actinomycetes bacterium]MCP4962416.1 HNH endonuclease [Actinomycetes bacterium]